RAATLWLALRRTVEKPAVAPGAATFRVSLRRADTLFVGHYRNLSRLRLERAAPALSSGRVPRELLADGLDHERLNGHVGVDAVVRERPVDVVFEQEADALAPPLL